jgi:hypothetical protein
MAFTTADRDALKKAIATGARRVKFGAGPDSREVEYRNLADMLSTLAVIERELMPSPASAVGFAEHTRD